jgi:phosphoribosylaminoimidazolecarboxamide formyltransferase/IMP cyclohydrolase
MVVVNLYPFVETVTRAEVSLDEALENIDIGGPSMIRSAAKNFPSVLVVVDPADYDAILQKLRQGNIDSEYRKRLAQKASNMWLFMIPPSLNTLTKKFFLKR